MDVSVASIVVNITETLQTGTDFTERNKIQLRTDISRPSARHAVVKVRYVHPKACTPLAQLQGDVDGHKSTK
jgi:hypothetical protein